MFDLNSLITLIGTPEDLFIHTVQPISQFPAVVAQLPQVLTRYVF